MSEAAGPQVRIDKLFLKDASFESPRSPEIFTGAWQPDFNLDINTRYDAMDDNRYEVVLTATARAKLKDSGKTALIVEIQQAGIFAISGCDDATTRRILGTFCPTTLFPYLRESLDALVVRGGFPPLQLAPVNFDALFAQAQQQAAATTEPEVKH